jgi:hypothetical protein
MSALLRVNWQDETQMRIAILAAMGQSNRSIMRYVDLSEGQINYRLLLARKRGVRRTDFRNGESALAKQIIKRSMLYVTGVVEARMLK